MKKKLILLGLLFSVRLIQSCCTCSETAQPFDFSRLRIRNLDNSGSYATWASSDTMYSAAVSFQVNVEGEPAELAWNPLKAPSFLSFPEAMAMECDCDPLFRANNPIAGIFILTLLALNPDIAAGTDITPLFLSKGNDFLYEELNDLLPIINREVYAGEAQTSFQIFLRENVENEKAQFLIRVELTNGEIIEGTTNQIHILPSFDEEF